MNSRQIETPPAFQPKVTPSPEAVAALEERQRAARAQLDGWTPRDGWLIDSMGRKK